MLAKKAAMLDGCVYVVYRKSDGTYSFDKEGTRWMALLLNINITCDGKFEIEGFRR